MINSRYRRAVFQTAYQDGLEIRPTRRKTDARTLGGMDASFRNPFMGRCSQ
jgi:hypothetical protein